MIFGFGGIKECTWLSLWDHPSAGDGGDVDVFIGLVEVFGVIRNKIVSFSWPEAVEEKSDHSYHKPCNQSNPHVSLEEGATAIPVGFGPEFDGGGNQPPDFKQPIQLECDAEYGEDEPAVLVGFQSEEVAENGENCHGDLDVAVIIHPLSLTERPEPIVFVPDLFRERVVLVLSQLLLWLNLVKADIDIMPPDQDKINSGEGNEEEDGCNQE